MYYSFQNIQPGAGKSTFYKMSTSIQIMQDIKAIRQSVDFSLVWFRTSALVPTNVNTIMRIYVNHSIWKRLLCKKHLLLDGKNLVYCVDDLVYCVTNLLNCRQDLLQCEEELLSDMNDLMVLAYYSQEQLSGYGLVVNQGNVIGGDDKVIQASFHTIFYCPFNSFPLLCPSSHFRSPNEEGSAMSSV